MLKGLLLGLLGLLWIVPQAVSNDLGLITTMDPQLTKDWYLFHRPHSVWKVHPAIRRGWDSHDSSLVRVVLYFDPKEGDLRSRLSGEKGVVVYPQSYVPPVGAHPWGFYLADVSMSLLDSLLNLGIIKRAVAAYRPLYPLNNRAAAETGVLWAREGELSLTGRGVRIGVLDSGFQLTHPDLPAPAEAMNYADYPDTNDDVTDRVSGHGTHVAGTLLGRGTQSGGLWAGMAPDAEPIYFKIGNDSNAWASTSAVVGALKGCATWANAQIVSMSYGGWDGFNDGSSPEEQTVDWVVSQGVSVFMSAGNSAVDGTHFTASVDPGDTLGPIPIVVRFAGDSIAWSLALSWWDGVDTSVHRSLELLVRNGEGAVMRFEALPQVSSPRGTEYREFLAPDFLPVDSTSYYYVYVFNRSNSRQPFHLWIITDHWFMRFLEPSPYGTVLLPSTADSCISVGSYTSRSEWIDYRGEVHNDQTTIGNISYFSSRGPRIDGILKPDIVAPGQRLISCRDTNNIVLGGGYDPLIVNNRMEEGLPADYVVFMGTSMASPSAAGSAALILELHRQLSPAELRELIYHNTLSDRFTGQLPNLIWGRGKINIASALSYHSDKSPLVPNKMLWANVYPNPSNREFTVEIKGVLSGEDVYFVLQDVMGRVVWEEQRLIGSGEGFHFTVKYPQGIPSGTYWLKVSAQGYRHTVRRLIYLK